MIHSSIVYRTTDHVVKGAWEGPERGSPETQQCARDHGYRLHRCGVETGAGSGEAAADKKEVSPTVERRRPERCKDGQERELRGPGFLPGKSASLRMLV